MGRQCNTIQYNTEWKEIHVLCDSNTIKLIVTKLGRKNYRFMMTLMMTMMMMMIVSVANSSTQL